MTVIIILIMAMASLAFVLLMYIAVKNGYPVRIPSRSIMLSAMADANDSVRIELKVTREEYNRLREAAGEQQLEEYIKARLEE